MPKVSVLIPTYNYAYCLDDCIQSVLTQTFQDFEIVIIDDGSRDNTDEVVEKHLSDPRIRYYKNPVNLGLVPNWNKCLDQAKGEYIKILCADDKFRPETLSKMVSVMEQYPNVSLVVCNKKMFGKSSLTVELPLKGLHPGKEVINHTLNTFGWLGEPTCAMFRRSNVEKVGKFKVNTTWLPDWEMWIRQLSVGDCYLVPEVLADVRNHPGQLTKRVMRNFTNYFEEYELCRNIKDGNGYDKSIAQGIDMDKVLKIRAENCAKAMYKLVKRLGNKDDRKLFFKAFKIARREKMLLQPLLGRFAKTGDKKTVLTYKNEGAVSA